ncbi:MAG: sorbosone dehydrogenase family protein [Pseudomonadota bacterium]
MTFRFLFPIVTAAGFFGASCATARDLPIEEVSLPPGFSISVFADNVPNARAMALGDQGTLFVGSRRDGRVHAVKDADGDGRAERVYEIASGLTLPSGIAFRDGSLYIGAVSTIYRLDNIENRLDNPPEPVVVNDDFPSERHHGWKYLGFGPDGKLYVPVGAPCNVCEEDGYAEIQRMDPDGSNVETYARGVRNTVGFDWHPETGELWFTDNGRDMLGDDIPACELNHASEAGQHFGFPYCHAGDLADPEFGDKRSCNEFRPPAQKLGPHVAPLGMRFLVDTQFPAEYQGHILMAEHGSWNRSKKIGYRLTLARLDGNQVTDYEVFASGWLREDESVWGRPADVLVWSDGSVLISDDSAGAIYRITYTAPLAESAP